MGGHFTFILQFAMGPQRERNWCFTLNNYSLNDITKLENVPCIYVIYGKETAPTTGTPHLQGFISFKEGKTLAAAKKVLGPHYHLEAKMGTIKQAVDYCKKDGDFVERGKISMREPATSDWADVICLAEAGDMVTLKTEYPRHYLMYFKTLMSIRAFNSTPIDGDLSHEWWTGPTGTGKSRRAWAEYPDHYSKPVNKWWDGYYGQDVVVIEEWEPKNEMTAAKLKIWADRYPFPAEIKGGTIQKVRPTKIIVTSNYTIEECFPNQQDREPLLRRFKVVTFPIMELPPPSPLFPIFQDFSDLEGQLFEF